MLVLENLGLGRGPETILQIANIPEDGIVDLRRLIDPPALRPRLPAAESSPPDRREHRQVGDDRRDLARPRPSTVSLVPGPAWATRT